MQYPMESLPPPSYPSAPIGLPTPLFATAAYPGTILAAPYVTTYVPLQTVSTLSGASSHASVKQHSRAEVVARTVHLRCLPPFMKQREMAEVFDTCGEYLRVRICGNAATHQKWVYGFVEFATAEAAAAMLTHSGMELSNGPDKPPLRLKCSPSKQPILDCMAYDADVVSGTPCGFGRGYLAECTLNDALLVVGQSPNAVGSPSSTAGSVVAGAALSVSDGSNTSARKNTATGCGCGCTGVNCCACCKCGNGVRDGELHAAGSQTAFPLHGAVADSAGLCRYNGDGSSNPSSPAAALQSAAGKNEGALTSPQPTPNTVTAASIAAQQEAIKQLFASPTPGAIPNMPEIKELAAAFQGLRCSAAVQDGQLDGPAIVARAETMTLDALTRASHLSSDTRIQDILCDLAQLLGFLDANAAVTGGAAQTGSGDCTATLPQRVTQLRMLANLVGALLCLLRRSVADAVPYVEAVLVTFAQIPPSSLLLLRARHREAAALSATGVAAKPATGSFAVINVPSAVPATVEFVQGPGSRCSGTEREHFLSLSRGACIDEDVTDALLDLINDDDDDVNEDDDGAASNGSGHGSARKNAPSRDGHVSMEGSKTNDVLQLTRAMTRGSISTTSMSSDDSVACLASAEMAELFHQDAYFSGYTLNALVAVGLAMEGVHPALSRSAYTLANKRAVEIFGCPNEMLVKCLASPSANPQLCEMIFGNDTKEGQGWDVTFFPRRFFESVKATWMRVRDTRGTNGFYRLLPPNYVVPLFQT